MSGAGLAVVAAMVTGVLPGTAMLARHVIRSRRLRLVAAGPTVQRERPRPPFDVELIIMVVRCALRSGAPLLRALDVTAGELGDVQRGDLRRFVEAIRMGVPWDRAMESVGAQLRPVLLALRPAWELGASADDALRMLGDQRRRDRLSLARRAAARLSVHLVMPLGLCSLPAFTLLGLVPFVLSFGGSLGL